MINLNYRELFTIIQLLGKCKHKDAKFSSSLCEKLDEIMKMYKTIVSSTKLTESNINHYKKVFKTNNFEEYNIGECDTKHYVYAFFNS